MFFYDALYGFFLEVGSLLAKMWSYAVNKKLLSPRGDKVRSLILHMQTIFHLIVSPFCYIVDV